MKDRKFISSFSNRYLRCAEAQPKRFRDKISLFFLVMGPGLITAFADNDAGGIATYITAGAKYGYSLLFVLLISTLCLAVAQEISARTGVVTGRGLFDLIRGKYGKRCSMLVLVTLLIANIGTTASEFSGIAIGFEIFSLNKWFTVPTVAFLIWLLVVKANYNYVEKVFFILCTAFVSYIISGFLVDPPWREVITATFIPDFSGDSGFLLMAMGIVGTTITPWGQFYIQASVVDKGISAKEYRYVLMDVLIGTFFTGLVAAFVIIVTATTLHGTDYAVENVKEAAVSLVPLAGVYAKWLFGIGLLGASLLAAIILPLSTAYAVCEALGFEHGISKTYQEAQAFFNIYTLLIALGAGLVLLPNLSLYHLMLATQVINGILLPPILIFMLLIANDAELMGSYKNPRLYHGLAWIFTWMIIALTAMLLLATLFPGMFIS